MEFESAREVMERRYGRLDSGQTALRIAGREYRLREILAHWMLDVEGVLSIDGGDLGRARYILRYDRSWDEWEIQMMGSPPSTG